MATSSWPKARQPSVLASRSNFIMMAMACLLLCVFVTLIPTMRRCANTGKGWLCMNANAHPCDIAPLTCLTVVPASQAHDQLFVSAPGGNTPPSSAVKALLNKFNKARIPVAAPVPVNDILKDIYAEGDEKNEWQRGNEYRRSEWLAQMRMMDGSEQSKKYDSNIDEYRIWAHSPFYPIWTCPYSLRLGNIGDGGKWVCYPNKLAAIAPVDQKPACIVYSFGSNGDFSFETSILQQNSECEIHTFDPMASYADLAPESITYHPMALTGNTARAIAAKSSSAPSAIMAGAKTIKEIRSMLGHEGKRVSILKMDIEWSEWYFLDDYFRDNDMWATQILMEVHLPMVQSYTLLANIFRLMDHNGYRLFAKEHNIDCRVCHEFAWYRVQDLPPSTAANSMATPTPNNAAKMAAKNKRPNL